MDRPSRPVQLIRSVRRIGAGALRGGGFRHGVHPPDSKRLTTGVPIRRMPFPSEIVLPLRQHAGKPAIPIVACTT